MSYLVIKTTRSPAVIPHSDHWATEHVLLGKCEQHPFCYGIRWIEGRVTHEIHVVLADGSVAPVLNPPSVVYSVHGLGDGHYHNIQWCRKYCGGRPPSELQEEFSE
jgi:hypothetical protein